MTARAVPKTAVPPAAATSPLDGVAAGAERDVPRHRLGRRLLDRLLPPPWRPYVALVAAAMLACWIAALAWWLLMPKARTLAIDIPRGAALQVAAGQVPSGVPNSLFIRIGDTLAIHNGDLIPYQVGPAFIPPGSYERVPVTSAFFVGGTVFCSFHPGGALTVTPRAQPSALVTLPIGLAGGIPVSLAAAVALFVVRRLDDPAVTESDA